MKTNPLLLAQHKIKEPQYFSMSWSKTSTST